jgi:hypothetical protein
MAIRMEVSQKKKKTQKLKIELPYDPAILLAVIYSEGCKSIYNTSYTCF